MKKTLFVLGLAIAATLPIAANACDAETNKQVIKEAVWEKGAILKKLYCIPVLMKLLEEHSEDGDCDDTDTFKDKLAKMLLEKKQELDQKLDEEDEKDETGEVKNMNLNRKGDTAAMGLIIGGTYRANEGYKTLARDIISRYAPGAKSAKRLLAGIKDAVESVRATEGELYKKLAKYVGRVNHGNLATGTGTIIAWDDMPDEVKGKVVLTVAHNYYGTAEKKKIVDKIGECENIGGLNTVVEVPGGNAEPGKFGSISFQIDMCGGTNDIVVYAPGTRSMEGGENNDENHKVSEVSKVYCIMDDEYKSGSGLIPDIAILILKDKVVDGGAVLNGVGLEVDKDYFTVGYGMVYAGAAKYANYYAKYMSGWNTKKKTLPVRITGKVGLSAGGGKLDEVHFRVWQGEGEGGQTNVGPSDSGSAVVDEENNIVGVEAGTSEVATGGKIFEWIKGIGERERGNNKK
ncbi:MAG: hypothetical protein LBJ16_00965 [Holosporaceae bacterium]|nr:hypothetical protein [Holosporaceae bacterium]